MNMTKKISILGSTGSIGVQTLDIVDRHPDKFQIVALSCGNNVDVVAGQIKKFKPQLVSVATDAAAQKLKQQLNGLSCSIMVGAEGAVEVASHPDAHVVISSIVGAAGLMPTLAALRQGKTVGLANKESMVIAGQMMSDVAKKHGATILPVDSEHSAIFQCLQGQSVEDVKRIILTASGGPFLHKSLSDFKSITVKDALKHPNWDMGAKITIDSASMMNKGLEVMEARWLFNMPTSKIGVVVHPQSIIHSMVEYNDGSVLAQMGNPDMRVPIAYALSYPRRIETGTTPLDLPKLSQLTFFEPDLVRFPSLKLAFDVAEKADTYPAVLNAANEIAVDAFLKEKIGFVDIPKIVENTLLAHKACKLTSLDVVVESDRWARECAGRMVV
ncbi:1-deoxy-D-xylulose-5-phosphate reductoisomerase [bacterium]|nr:1-deoxy-D-xylulose-5-phosphate reductoisomerase [bacterium]